VAAAGVTAVVVSQRLDPSQATAGVTAAGLGDGGGWIRVRVLILIFSFLLFRFFIFQRGLLKRLYVKIDFHVRVRHT
jgi:hypothetical protein